MAYYCRYNILRDKAGGDMVMADDIEKFTGDTNILKKATIFSAINCHGYAPA